MAKILAFGLFREELEKVKKAAASQKIRVENVPTMLYKQTIGTLSQGRIDCLVEAVQVNREEEIFTGEPPKEQMLVFCDMESAQLDKQLAALRRVMVQVDYKAVMTPTNENWNVLRLYAELEREKRSMEFL